MDFSTSSAALALLVEDPSSRGRSPQASPTLSIPQPATVASTSTFDRTPQLSWSLMPPLATSRGFHRNISPPRARPQQAKTAQVGFLHLPKEVRFRIYELAIYDHDRTAVFLPRNHPRKVEPEVDDVDVVWVYEDMVPTDGIGPIAKMYEVGADHICKTAASGCWVGEEDLQTATRDLFEPAFLANDDLTDNQLLARLDADDEQDAMSDESGSSLPEEIMEPQDWHEAPYDPLQGHDIFDPDNESVSDCSCACPTCTPEESSDDLFGLRSAGGSEDEDEDSCTCRKYCGERRLQDSMEEGEASYGDGNPINIFHVHDNVDGDDYEHFDPDEDIGMLYEPMEPSVLLASKQIRAECLPVYYAQNAFSWRFQWTAYLMSCKSFKAWAQSIDPDHLKLVTKISFEGRHVVEEGIEFSIDIDLLDAYPFFETNVYGGDSEHEIADALNREAATYLWMMSQSERSRPVFTSGHLCDIANIFAQAMHRDAGGCLHENATACRVMLNPLF